MGGGARRAGPGTEQAAVGRGGGGPHRPPASPGGAAGRAAAIAPSPPRVAVCCRRAPPAPGPLRASEATPGSQRGGRCVAKLRAPSRLSTGVSLPQGGEFHSKSVHRGSPHHRYRLSPVCGHPPRCSHQCPSAFLSLSSPSPCPAGSVYSQFRVFSASLESP